MSFKAHAVPLLLLYLSQSIVISRADWVDLNSQLLAPDPQEDVVWSFEYNPLYQRAMIRLEEEVNRTVCIAVINYEGSEAPAIGLMEGKKSNFILGAEIKKNSTTDKWLLLITKKQDYEEPIMRDYRFSIIAGSQPYPMVALNIENIDDNPPIIRPKDKRCEIEENYSGPSNCTYVVSDADGWIEQVEFFLSSAPQDSGKKHFGFVTSRVTGAREKYDLDAYLNVTESLDFETVSMYMLQIRAIDGAKNEGNLETVVEVVDKPDMPPAWTSITAAENIFEKTTKTFSVSATDGDRMINATINYRIKANEGEEKYFVVDQQTGVITINKIDRDKLQNEVFRFLIIAYEVPEPESSINATIIVIVEDVNDHIPEISPKSLKINIDEEKYTSLDFGEPISITDPDLAGNGQYDVSLIDESEHNWSSAFIVVPNTGYQSGIFSISILNASVLDYEDENWRNIEIMLRAVEKADPSHVDVRNISIRLNNWNDELPIFDLDNLLEVSVKEDVPMGHKIATVHATDRDVGDHVIHSLGSQRALTIDNETGVIVTNETDALDYEAMPVVVVQVVAEDMANHKTYAALTINVIDVNDVPPNLYLPKKTPSLVEESPTLTTVEALINATDIDTDAELHFSIDWDNTSARKKSVTVDESLYRGHLDIRTEYPNKHTRFAVGTLFVTDRIDYEAFDVIIITISVTDSKTVHKDNTTSATLTLNIIDINDNAPIFVLPEPMDVVENQVTDARIGVVVATDADGPQFNNVSYSIVPINGTKNDLVHIHPLTGVIKVGLNKSIDAEEYEYIYYNVIATDGELNTPLPIKIFVIDQNDEEPRLSRDEFDSTIEIPEKSPSGTEILRVSATDEDRTYPFNNVSYLINVDYSESLQYFTMGKYTGLLEVNLTGENILDRDFGKPEFTLNLKLRDNYLVDHVTWNTNSVDFTVKIILKDINDQKPLLPDQTKPVDVSETTKKNDFIMTVTASDRDDPATENTKVFYEIRGITPIDGIYDGPGDDCEDLFFVQTRDQKGADIFANCDLRGYYGSWSVELYAQDLGTDPGPQNHTNDYVIRITDYNYYDPVIVFPKLNKKIPLKPEQTPHTELKTYDDQRLNDFTASDRDHGNSGNVTFSLASSGDNEYFELVQYTKNVARLQLAKPVDPEKQDSYRLTVSATDGGNPSRRVSQNVTVIFVSSLGPVFENANWTVWIKENKTGLGESVVIPEARDTVTEVGGDSVDVYYFFIDKDADTNFFELKNATRNLTVVTELDRETQEVMTLHVVATTDKNGPPRNPLDNSVLKIIVIVLDVNDNAPILQIPFRAGIAKEDPLDHVILTVKATDADINDTLKYSVIAGTTSMSDPSLQSVHQPFSLNPETGELSLKFTPTSNMKGNFEFDVIVHDAENHNDTGAVTVYIISQNNRVVFTFNNPARQIQDERNFIVASFETAFKYLCNIDDIKSAVDSENHQLDNMTTLTTHFISPNDHLPINSDAIILASSDLQTMGNLKETLREKFLRLVDVPTGSAVTTDNLQETIQWVLVTLTIFFGLCTVMLLVAFIIKTRRLNERLDKLAITRSVSQESGMDKAGVVPTTNQFAVAGSNPMWKTADTKIDDNISQGSGDSDLIGIEDNPDFGYSNEAPTNEELFDSNGRLQGSVNPVLASHQALFGDLYDGNFKHMDSTADEETRNKY